jgi:hypothetical protein
MSIKIVGKMVNQRPMIFSAPVNRAVEADDVLRNDDGEFLRVIGGGQNMQTVTIELPVEEEADYADTLYSVLAGTGQM